MSEQRELGTVLEGKYRLERLLGEGGMGTVYEARHVLIGRRLAIKFLHRQYVENTEVVQRFQREAQAAAAIGHDNIVDVTDMGTAPDGAPYIVMEYLSGQDLMGVLQQEGALDPGRAANIMVQSLSALHAAHQAGIIHRDLKPDNIYLVEKPNRSDYVKLLDFGISKFRTLEPEGSRGLTQTGTVLGTPCYMSPEQARGNPDLSTKSDIYAMGVILYQMLTGVQPFYAPNYNALMIKILQEEAPNPLTLKPDLPPRLVEAVKIAMYKEPATRFTDCMQFNAFLLEFVTDTKIDLELVTLAKPPEHISTAKTMVHKTVQTPLNTVNTQVTQYLQQKRWSKKAKLAGIAAGVILVALLVAGIFGRGAGTPPEIPVSLAPATPQGADSVPAANPPSPQPQARIGLQLRVEPEEAQIKIDGELKGKSPIDLWVGRDDAVHTVEIHKAGYVPLSAELRFEKDTMLTYTLEKKKSAKQAEKKRRADKKRKKSKSRSSSRSKKKRKRPKRSIDNADPWS